MYSLLIYVSMPAMLFYLGLRGMRDHRYWQRWGERLGFSSGGCGAVDVVVHASSMGEVSAVSPMIEALLAQKSGLRVLITTFTPTGSQRVNELFGDRVQHRYLPLDLPGATKRFFRAHQPRAVLVVETEIWPNLYRAARLAGAPLIMVNARMTKKSLKSYLRLKRWVAPALGGLHAVLAQSAADAERFEASGAPAEKIHITGNLKFDAHVAASVIETGDLIKSGWGRQRPAIVAGSTHEKDESALVAAYRALSARVPELLLVLVPRHPERFKAAADGARKSGLQVSELSNSRLVAPQTQCLVVDVMGELMGFYAAADVCFVGGTIEPIGGHNVLEPALLGKPIVVGPHTRNVHAILGQLLEANAVIQVRNEEELQSSLGALLADGAARDRLGQAALSLAEAGRGALDRNLEWVIPLLDETPGRPGSN